MRCETDFEICEVFLEREQPKVQADVRSHSIRIVNRLEAVCDMCGE